MKTKEQLILEGTDPSYVGVDQISWLTVDQISWLTVDQTKALKEFVELAKWDKPYTSLLEAIKRPGQVLEMSSWHSCETTHCVGGWTTTLAPGGKELERRMGTREAARFILLTSRPDAPLPNFTASNEAARAFVEARAEEEK